MKGHIYLGRVQARVLRLPDDEDESSIEQHGSFVPIYEPDFNSFSPILDQGLYLSFNANCLVLRTCREPPSPLARTHRLHTRLHVCVCVCVCFNSFVPLRSPIEYLVRARVCVRICVCNPHIKHTHTKRNPQSAFIHLASHRSFAKRNGGPR